MKYIKRINENSYLETIEDALVDISDVYKVRVKETKKSIKVIIEIDYIDFSEIEKLDEYIEDLSERMKLFKLIKEFIKRIQPNGYSIIIEDARSTFIEDDDELTKDNVCILIKKD